eukprot:s282_g24.t1
MQPSHAATLGWAPRAPRAPRVLHPAPCGAAVAKAPAVPRSSLAFAAVTGAIAWKTWTARRQRAPQQVEKMNTKKLGLEVRNFLSTGSLTLDLALCGGLPRGRMVEIFGEPQSGKTSLALSCLRAALQNKQSCAVLDVDRQWPQCDARFSDQLLRARPKNAEEAMEMMVDLVNSRYDLIILDSVASLISKEELEADISSTDGGFAVPKLLSKFCTRMEKILPGTGTTIIFINLVRNSRWSDYGSDSEVTCGGNAVKYRCSLRIAVRQLERPRWSEGGEDEDVKAVKTLLEVVKNKDGPKGPPVECDLLLGKGISWESSVVEAAMDLGVLADADAADAESDGASGAVVFQGLARRPSDWAKNELDDNMMRPYL